MATDFIIMRTDLCRDQRVLRMARRLKIDEFSVAGRLLEVWTWADETAVCVDPRGAVEPEDVTEKAGHRSRPPRDGLVTGVPLSYIDRVAHMPGFGDAMAAEGWVIEEEDESHDVRLRFPRFDKWNWGGARERAKNAIRKKRSRDKRDECHGESVTDVTEKAGQMSRENRDACPANGVTTEQNRTVLKDRTVQPASATGGIESPALLGVLGGGDARGEGTAGWLAGLGVESLLQRLSVRQPALGELSRAEGMTAEAISEEWDAIWAVAIETQMRNPVGVLIHRLAERFHVELSAKVKLTNEQAKCQARIAQLRMIAESQRSAAIASNGKGSGSGHQAEEGSGRKAGVHA